MQIVQAAQELMSYVLDLPLGHGPSTSLVVSLEVRVKVTVTHKFRNDDEEFLVMVQVINRQNVLMFDLG